MAKERNRPLLVPQYMHDFQCIGAACEDSCCVGWSVMIDEATFKKYRKLKKANLGDMLTRYVKRNRSNPNSSQYAKIKLNPGASCPFHDEDMLCMIHKELGEGHLSLTCTTYPRVTNKVNDVFEKSLTVSCPEATRLALLKPEVMEFDQLVEGASVRNTEGKALDTRLPALTNRAERYFWELRIFSISVLQNRQYTLEERLIILGLFYQKVTEYLAEDKARALPELIAHYTNIVERGELRDSLEQIPSNTSIQMRLLKELTDERFFKGINSKRYLECYTQFLQGLGYVHGASLDNIMEMYTAAYDSHYKPYFSEKAYILENYVVNYVFKNLFPFSGEKKVFDNYVMLVVHYALIKMLLIGMSVFHKDNFGDEQVIKLIQSFAKTVEHNNPFVRNMFDMLQKSDMTNMAYMAILIKN